MADILDLHVSLSKFSLERLFWKRTLGWFLNDNPTGLSQPSRNKNHQQTNMEGQTLWSSLKTIVIDTLVSIGTLQ